MTQFVASSFGELGIQSQYLDGELYLVDDSLSGRLVARPKLKIGKVIADSISIFVVHALKGCKRATKMFRHYVAVLQNFAAATNVEPHVSRGMLVTFGIDRAPRASFPAALFTTEFLSFVVARMLAVFGLHQAAFFCDATQLALKSRNGFFVHGERLPDSFAAVKGVV